MANEKRLNRDVGLKPRETGKFTPEKLERILGRIYTEETTAELMDKLMRGNSAKMDGGKDNE